MNVPKDLALALGILVGAIAVLLALVTRMAKIGADYGEDHRGLRRLFRERKFGLLSIFGVTAAIAIALTLLRAIWGEFNVPVANAEESFALGLGIGAAVVVALLIGGVIVGFVWLLFADNLERGESDRLKRHARAPDIEIRIPTSADEESRRSQ